MKVLRTWEPMTEAQVHGLIRSNEEIQDELRREIDRLPLGNAERERKIDLLMAYHRDNEVLHERLMRAD